MSEGWIAFVVSTVVALLVNECGELSPWLARRVIRWAARVRYPGREEEFEALIEARPGKLFKLVTALGFACAALRHLTARRFAGPLRVATLGLGILLCPVHYVTTTLISTGAAPDWITTGAVVLTFASSSLNQGWLRSKLPRLRPVMIATVVPIGLIMMPLSALIPNEVPDFIGITVVIVGGIMGGAASCLLIAMALGEHPSAPTASRPPAPGG